MMEMQGPAPMSPAHTYSRSPDKKALEADNRYLFSTYSYLSS